MSGFSPPAGQGVIGRAKEGPAGFNQGCPESTSYLRIPGNILLERSVGVGGEERELGREESLCVVLFGFFSYSSDQPTMGPQELRIVFPFLNGWGENVMTHEKYTRLKPSHTHLSHCLQLLCLAESSNCNKDLRSTGPQYIIWLFTENICQLLCQRN